MRVGAEERGALNMTKWGMALGLALAIVLGTTGCAEDDPTGKPGVAEYEKERAALANRAKKPAKAKKKKPAAVEATPALEGGTGYAVGEKDYFYDPRDKRDPFRSIRYLNMGPAKKDFGPLADFELGQLELSAVIWDAENPRALVLDPGGRSYIIHEGSAIGKNNGQVIHIGDNLVLVKETYENFAGDQTTKDVELRIRLSQGG